MKVIKTKLEGLLILKPKVFKDHRGLFYESWKAEDYKKAGINNNFVQDNVSKSKKNVLRGLHCQEGQSQLVTIVSGRIFDVVADIRKESKTYSQYFSIELNSVEPQQLYMEPGLVHGFYVLSDTAIINYKCTQYYNAAKEGSIIWNDPTLNIQWPNLDNLIISGKDQKLPRLISN